MQRPGRHFSEQKPRKNAAGRTAYGNLASLVGMACNLLLCLGKLAAGTLFGSIAIMADALNNLSDASSNVVSLVGFRLAAKGPDEKHPYGHARYEYLAGLVVCVTILAIGLSLLKESALKVLHPTAVVFSWLSVGVLAASIGVKLWMSRFNKTIGQRINSETLMATAADSLSDMASTAVVLLGTLAGHFFRIQLVGYLGVLVAIFILYTGVSAMKDTIDPLLGRAPDPALVAGIRRLALAPPEILGLHDLIVHDYGPGRLFASLHAEVDKDDDISAIHDIIDTVERQIYHELGCEICIHMDPIAVGDKKTAECRIMAANLLAEIDPKLTMHDFRITSGPDHTNLIFDVVRPLDCKYTSEELQQRIQAAVSALPGRYFAVITVDTPRI